MPLHLVTADQRLAEANSKTTAVLLGPAKIGKTSQLLTLDPATTLCIDIEAGMQAVQTWTGDSVPVRAWDDMLDVACLIGGPSPAARFPQSFCKEHYDSVLQRYGDAIKAEKYRTIFVDSITDMTRLANLWAQQQPDAITAKGTRDGFAIYGALARETIAVLKHLQHAAARTTIFVGILEMTTDDYNRQIWQPQMDGAKAARELLGIVDSVISYQYFDYTPPADEVPGQWVFNPASGAHRAFVCRSPNPWSLPAGNRSGNLELIEEPNLARLIEKMNAPGRATAAALNTSRPDQPEPKTTKAKGK